MFAAIACTIGVVPHLLAPMTGPAAVQNARAIAFPTRRWLGVAYLLLPAWQTWRDPSAITVEENPEPMSFWGTIRTAVLLTVLNPKLTTFSFAFLPPFVPANEPDGFWHMVGLSLVFMAVTFFVFAPDGIFAAQIRAPVIRLPKVMTGMRRIFSGAYVVLAGRVALESR